MTHQLMYSSKATAPLSDVEINQILDKARTQNSANSITGALLYMDDVFFQVLEGDKETVHATMDKIKSDPRHQDITIFYEGNTDKPIFQQWKMAFLYVTPEEMSNWSGIPGTTTLENILSELENAEQVPKLLINILTMLK